MSTPKTDAGRSTIFRVLEPFSNMMREQWVTDSNAALVTDLYELTMLQSYFDQGMNDTAVFDLFMRRLPSTRNYLVACGLEHVLHYLETFSFSDDGIAYLRSLNRF